MSIVNILDFPLVFFGVYGIVYQREGVSPCRLDTPSDRSPTMTSTKPMTPHTSTILHAEWHCRNQQKAITAAIRADLGGHSYGRMDRPPYYRTTKG